MDHSKPSHTQNKSTNRKKSTEWSFCFVDSFALHPDKSIIVVIMINLSGIMAITVDTQGNFDPDAG